MKDVRTVPVFGKRNEPHTVIIARGDEIRHFTVRPWVAALCGSVAAAFAIGYLLATSYLVLRDDLIGATVARQARLQQAYEDRISALRSQVDRITSRQLLDQQLMESKVSELLDRQSELAERDGRLLPLLQRAGASLPKDAPVPTSKPDVRAEAETGAPEPAAYAAAAPAAPAIAALSRFALGQTSSPRKLLSTADHSDRLFVEINRSLRVIENQQLTRIRSLAESAYQTADAISETLREADLKLDPGYGERDVGGPLFSPDDPRSFDTEVTVLDEALDALDEMKAVAVRLPLANPAPGRPVSSGFGIRKDPLLGRPAHHSGIDFRAVSGAPVRATGAGTVVRAGWNGGYGRMVEVDHGNGLATRYAHMSRIGVKVGDKVELGSIVGKVGSSGRSTGPHLHYEVRRNGSAVNPLRYLKAGKRIAQLL